MSFLEFYFDILGSEKEEVAVCCPFPHFTSNGLPYREQHPSAHVNTEDKLFHCQACKAGYSDMTFLRTILGCTITNAIKLQKIFENPIETVDEWDNCKVLPDNAKRLANSLGLSDAIIEELKISSIADGTLMFPVFMYNKLLDVRHYTPGGTPKVRSRKDCMTGLIIPYDIWKESPKNKLTLICAGEKDMANARSRGFNAITVTGGENTLPIITEEFKDREVAIVYDNDGAGKEAAVKLAKALHPIVKSVKVVTGFHEVCKENKEDITDFFMKYNKNRDDLIKYIKLTPIFAPPPEDKDLSHPILDLHAASDPKYLGKIVRSNIQVVATSEASFSTPSLIIGEKMRDSEKDNVMSAGEIRDWNLNEETAQDLLHLIDNNFKEEDVEKNIRNILKIPVKEKYVKIKKLTKETVYKSYVTDLFETTNTDIIPMEYTAYTIGTKLESGKKYLVTYKLIPHPYKGQQLTMIIIAATNANDSVSNFKVTPDVVSYLSAFQNIKGSSIEEKINTVTEKFKGLLGYNGNNTLIQAMDLSYHTVLQFNLGQFKNIRGYLDTIIVGESRMGKSSTAEALRTTYNLGVFTSLAGTAATIPGLVGGSNKVNGSYQTRAGLIPQNHKGLIIFEEFGKSNNNIITELTDIRSSNEVRITRVSGTLTMPAIVRMITLTNVKTTDGLTKPIASYPHGIAVITELIGTAEDIARYDLMIVLSDRGASQIDPFWQPEEPFTLDEYRTRVRWIWSRTPEQIIITPEVGRYIVEQANIINSKYDCHIKIFGTEAWKKIARLSIAVAGYLVSTDNSYENIIVEKEHVDFSINFFEKVYNNSTFKLKEYVEHERKYSTIDDDGTFTLQDIYIKCPGMLLHLEQYSKTSKNMLTAATGLNNDDYNSLMNRLISGLFIRFAGYDIIPTERFRLGMTKINRDATAKKLGDIL